MSQTVWKTTIPVQDEPFSVLMPGNARLERVEVDRDPGVLHAWWYVANPEQDTENRRTLAVTGTGGRVPMPWRYLGSAAPHAVTGLVWHLWEVFGG